MPRVDCLSRNPHEEPAEPEIATLDVMIVKLSIEDWLLTLQLGDPKLNREHFEEKVRNE